MNNSSVAVLADSQFSVARVFRPTQGFEAYYDGLSSRVPIVIPGGLDPDAGQTGYDPNLIPGIPVPMGSKVMLWIPTIFQNIGTEQDPSFEVVEYRYQIIWRLRNINDYRNRRGRSAYHFPRQSPGAGSQVVVPSAQQVVVFEGAKETLNLGTSGSQFENNPEVYATHEGVLERFEFISTTPLPPLISAGVNGAYQQGVAVLPSINVNETTTFNCVQFDALGDELLIAVDRMTIGADNWNFSTIDMGFSQFFGEGTGDIIRDLGIYVFTGSNP